MDVRPKELEKSCSEKKTLCGKPLSTARN